MKHIQLLAIKASEFISRRSILANNILKQNHNRNHLIILPTSDVQYKTNHIPRPFHHDTSFYYYTGFMEKRSALLININKSEMNTTLFIDNPAHEDVLWNGPYPSRENAKDITGIDNVVDYSDFLSYVTKSVPNKENAILWTINSINAQSFNHNLASLYKLMKRSSLDMFVDRQRIVKSKAEIELMRQASTIATEAIHLTMKFTQPYMNEQEILAKLFFEINIRGAKLAYPPVIAGGSRANIIHYLNSDKYINDNELVLVDVGADVLGYFSDLTRTWPVNGKYTAEQAILYDILHLVYTDCIEYCNAEKSLNEMYTFMLIQLRKYLYEERIIRNNPDMQQFCPHHIGHYLGLDIHDTPSVSTLQPLAPGTVFPMEPGLYISQNNESVDPRFRGIGMRLEDVFVISESGKLECLSKSLVRSRTEIENLCNSSANESVSQSSIQ